MFEERGRLVDCCILIADSIKQSPDYESTGTSYRFSRSYTVPVQEIEEFKKFIAATYDYFNQLCSRVYISGFSIETSSSVWTKERIAQEIKAETDRINLILNSKQSTKVK